MKTFQVIIIGGGLAGLTSAIDLSRSGYEVMVIEKQSYPRHKVCGEYLSNEVLPYLDQLGVDLSGGVHIDSLRWSVPGGRAVETKLPLGGTGMSRYELDNRLYKHAEACGVTFAFETVREIRGEAPRFTVHTKEYTYSSRVVIGAYGKRDALDKTLDRHFILKKSPWLAIKAHYNYPEWPENKVGLHTFRGGYGGLSATESGSVNFCYLVQYKVFKKYNNKHRFNSEILFKNSDLKEFLDQAEMIFEAPLSIAQISFEKKNPVVRGMLMCGDTAGMIHPLCGNGMAMAIHSAKIAAELVGNYLASSAKDSKELEHSYSQQWQAHFNRRLQVGGMLQHILLNETLATFAQATLARSPIFLKSVIRATHGKRFSL